MTAALRVQWVSCMPKGAVAELLEQSKRLCRVTVCEARNALVSIAKSEPDLVVFEFDDPAAEELHLLQAVKRLHPRVPILMITTTHSEELAVWAFRARAWNYLVKPVPLRELKSNLQQLAKISKRREPMGRQVERPGTMMPQPGVQTDGHSENGAMQRIIENLRKDHTSRVRVTKLARDCGMTRFSFSRLFRDSFGCSCREYVMRLRMKTACEMLEAPHLSVTHVASAAGFSDASYFSRMFRRHMRTSPGEYAKAAAGQRPVPGKRRRPMPARRA